MANPETKVIKVWSRNGKDSVDVLYKLNDDGETYSQSVVSSGGGSEAATIADGADVAQGTTTDAPASTTVVQTIAASNVIKLLKGLLNFFIVLSKGAGNTDSTTLRVVTAADGPLNTTQAAILTKLGAVGLLPDLATGAKSLTLTMSTGTGSVPIPDTAHLVGIKPVSTTMRVGLEATEADGTKTGAAVANDLKKGVPVDNGSYTWFNVGLGVSRTLYVAGGTSDVCEVVVM